MSELSEFIKEVRYSIENYGVSIEDIKDLERNSRGSILEKHNGHYYNSDDYCVVNNEIVSKDDCGFCEYYETYCDVDDVHKVYINNETKYYSQKAIDYLYLHFYRGAYYDDDALEHNDLVVMHDGEISDRDYAWYWESDCEYHYEEENRGGTYLRDYHNSPTRYKTFSDKATHRVGFEIEKEDSEVLESIDIDDFETQCPDWKKEEDGSLDCDSGFELISPAYELNTAKIFAEIEANLVLVEHINADRSTRCGGHINLSEIGVSGKDFFDKIKGYTPLLYALYYKRIGANYCKGKSNINLVREREKYQAINIHEDRIEIRIISAVKDVSNLKWRCKLMELIVKNQTSNIEEAYNLVRTKFKKHLSERYDKEGLKELMARVQKYSFEYEETTIIPDKER